MSVDESTPSADSDDSTDAALRELLHAPPVDPAEFFHATRAERLEPGTVLAETFEIRERLGRGGMGVVYRARHEALGRDVAIKLCRRQVTPRETARLLREAQSTAALAHPNIVVVHHVGTMDDQVYLVVEYVAGGTLRDWLDAEPRPWRSIVGKLVEAGRGLAAAHEHGLVHRDFKPDNVLIGRDERARVSDFGLAIEFAGAQVDEDDEAPDETLHTARASSTLHRAGTPRYMAPEQHAGEAVTPATDQFALCVVLYEALAGEHPFERDCAKPGARRRRNAIPRRVSGRVRAAIERGLSRDPADRHPSVQALVDRLVSDRSWAPVLVLVGLGSVGAVALAVAEPEDPCEMPLLEAPSWPPEARSAVRATYSKSPLGAGAALGERVETEVDRYLADWRRAEVDVCREDNGDDEALRTRHACLRTQAIELETLLDLLAKGEPEVLARSLGALARLTPPGRCSSDALSQLARETDDDDAALNEQLARARATLSAGQIDLAMDHANAAVGSAHDRYGRARAAMARYAVLDKRQDHAAAAAEGERALQLAISAGADEVAAEATQLLVYTAAAGLRDPEAAQRWADRADAWLARIGDPVPGRVTLDTYRALILRDLRKYDESEALLRDVLDRARTLDPPRPQMVVSAEVDLASTLQRAGRYDEAEAQLYRTLELVDNELGPDHPTRYGVLQMLSATLWRAGRTEEGIARSREVLAGYEAIYGPQSSRAGAAHINLGGTLLQSGDLDGAREHNTAALQIFEAHRDLAAQDIAVRNLSQIAIAADDLDEALARALHDVELTRQSEDKPNRVIALVNLAMIYNRRGDYDACYDTSRRLANVAAEAYESDDPERALAWLTIGTAARDVDKLGDAQSAYESGLALLRSTTGDADPSWPELVSGLASVHFRAERFDEAAALLADLDLATMTGDAERFDAELLLARIQLARADLDAARSAIDRARGYAEATGLPEAIANVEQLAAQLE